MSPYIYEHSDIPEGMTLSDYRRERQTVKPLSRRRRAGRAIVRRLRRR
ncbi:MAG: hypothetical protein H0T15_02430 [Thermoleophilaceae bacterium]|nr:hypothetical protein [Thermoleophilaceae bacterium]